MRNPWIALAALVLIGAPSPASTQPTADSAPTPQEIAPPPLPPGAVAPPPLPTLSGPLYAVLDGGQQGPFDEAAVKELVRSGRLVADTLVWMPSLSTWVAARQVPALAALLPAIPPPPPVATSPPTMAQPPPPAPPSTQATAEHWRSFLLGTWRNEVPVPELDAVVETVLTYETGGRFNGYARMYPPGRPEESMTVPSTGSWKVTPLSENSFMLILDSDAVPALQIARRTISAAVTTVDQNTLRAEDGTLTTRIGN
jgi:hypothetical protein